jgi:hypothetical protein
MPFWQRLLITVAVMLAVSVAGGYVWHWIFNSDVPAYLSGALGGLSALPAWEYLKRFGPNP